MTLLKTIQISASILSADMANLTAVTEGLERDGLDMLPEQIRLRIHNRKQNIQTFS